MLMVRRAMVFRSDADAAQISHPAVRVVRAYLNSDAYRASMHLPPEQHVNGLFEARRRVCRRAL